MGGSSGEWDAQKSGVNICRVSPEAYAASTHGRKQKSKCLHARGAGHRRDLALPQPALVVANLVLSINPS